MTPAALLHFSVPSWGCGFFLTWSYSVVGTYCIIQNEEGSNKIGWTWRDFSCSKSCRSRLKLPFLMLVTSLNWNLLWNPEMKPACSIYPERLHFSFLVSELLAIFLLTLPGGVQFANLGRYRWTCWRLKLHSSTSETCLSHDIKVTVTIPASKFRFLDKKCNSSVSTAPIESLVAQTG